MARCIRCSSTSVCASHSRYRLVHRSTLHPSMWINQYIDKHYRPTKMTVNMCAKSIFHLNNETINIWSHLLGFIYFTYRQVDLNLYSIPAIGGSWQDHLVLSVSVMGSQICMLMSAAYHTFGCQSKEKRKRWLQLDVFGISSGLLGMYLGGIYTAFFCFRDHLESYCYILLSIFFITLYVPLNHSSLTKKSLRGSRFGLLHFIYSIIILFGICPTIHWVFIHGGLSNEHVMRWFPSIIVLYTLLAAGFFFYISLIPEKYSPGRFDLVGCSHQWWHLLILAAMVYWDSQGIQLISYYRTTTDSCAIANQYTQNIDNSTNL